MREFQTFLNLIARCLGLISYLSFQISDHYKRINFFKEKYNNMGWFGKVVGGTIGFALGGPLGAVAGAAFGHTFDSSSKQRYINDNTRFSSGEEAQFTFFIAAFSMLAKLAKTDGRISKEEIDSIEDFMVKDLNLNPESRRLAMNIFHAATRSQETFHDFANQFYMQFSRQRPSQAAPPTPRSIRVRTARFG